MARTVRGNARKVTAVYTVPDPWSQQIASLGVMTNSFSPASAGIHRTGGASPRGFVGDAGYGVNRWAGRTTYPLQHFSGAAAPVLDPMSQRLGFGAGTGGQPGLPSTGGATGGLSSIAWLSWNPMGRAGMGG